MTAPAERNGKRAAPPKTALSQYDHFSPRLLEDPLWMQALAEHRRPHYSQIVILYQLG
jgi:hypothetical protein